MTKPQTVRLATSATFLDDNGKYIVENLATAETDTTLVAAPDGAGGVEFRAEAGGGVTLPIDAADVDVADAGGYFADADAEAVLQALGAIALGVQVHGSLGGTETFSAAVGTHTGTLSANCTFTLTAPTSGLSYAMALWLTGDGTSTITLPAAVVNKAALEAAYDPTIGLTMILILWTLDGGSSWVGGWWGGSSSVGALDDLSDVTIATPLDKQRLRYDATSSLWKNSSLVWELHVSYDGTAVLDGAGNPVQTEVTY